MSIPENYLIDDSSTLTGDNSKEIRYIYPDSSIIYITNEERKGSSLNTLNKMKEAIDSYIESYKSDTLYYKGIQEDGRFWAENFLGEIIIGYVNCPQDRKELFDKSLKTIRRKKKENCKQ